MSMGIDRAESYRIMNYIRWGRIDIVKDIMREQGISESYIDLQI